MGDSTFYPWCFFDSVYYLIYNDDDQCRIRRAMTLLLVGLPASKYLWTKVNTFFTVIIHCLLRWNYRQNMIDEEVKCLFVTVIIAVPFGSFGKSSSQFNTWNLQYLWGSRLTTEIVNTKLFFCLLWCWFIDLRWMHCVVR